MPQAVSGRVRIAIVIRISMMQSVGAHPEDWRALKSQVSTRHNQVFKPFRYAKRAVRKYAVVAERNSDGMVNIENDKCY